MTDELCHRNGSERSFSGPDLGQISDRLDQIIGKLNQMNGLLSRLVPAEADSRTETAQDGPTEDRPTCHASEPAEAPQLTYQEAQELENNPSVMMFEDMANRKKEYYLGQNLVGVYTYPRHGPPSNLRALSVKEANDLIIKHQVKMRRCPEWEGWIYYDLRGRPVGYTLDRPSE